MLWHLDMRSRMRLTIDMTTLATTVCLAMPMAVFLCFSANRAQQPRQPRDIRAGGLNRYVEYTLVN